VLFTGRVVGYLGAVFLVLSPVRAIVFVRVQQGLFGLYLGCSFAPNHKGMAVLAAGDALYTPELAARMLGFLRRAAGRGAAVLVGDPGRGHVPYWWLTVLDRYRVRGLGAPEDGERTEVSVLGSAC
jgi:hypothetical protein